ncbi:hypothetical protein K474DRAFT_1668525 [Panus rudis PR-1116 ss-1]|nr:hypothetical protein K474DRAFT_1668525 [Panus rudis PR-1116 ss-1]
MGIPQVHWQDLAAAVYLSELQDPSVDASARSLSACAYISKVAHVAWGVCGIRTLTNRRS